MVSLLVVVYTNWNLTNTTERGSRISWLAQAGFATFGRKGTTHQWVPFSWNRTTFPTNLATSWWYVIKVGLRRHCLPLGVHWIPSQNLNVTDRLHCSQTTFSTNFDKWPACHKFQRPTWAGIWKGIQWVPRGKQRLPLCRQSPNLLLLKRWQVYHLVVRFQHRGTHWWVVPFLPKVAKPAWANQLIQLPRSVVSVKFQFVYTTTSSETTQWT